MKITKPEDMKADTSKLEEAVDKFEERFAKEDKGQEFYHLVITGEYNQEVCSQIQKLYIGAGWRVATCRTSSQNGERPGLTGLQLWA